MDQNPDELPRHVFIQTTYGPMMINRHDINQTDKLLLTGQSPEHASIAMLADLMGSLREQRGDLTVLDVGANFGCFTLGLAAAAGAGGTVHAFEPQPPIFACLVTSVAMSVHTNIHCWMEAVGDQDGWIAVPQFDYDQPMNFGSVEFGRPQEEQLIQEPKTDRTEFVRQTTLDTHRAVTRCDVLKIDVEGMELAVLAGAAKLINQHRPIIFAEWQKCDHSRLRDWLMNLGYDVTQIELDFLAVPKGVAQ